MRLKSRRGLVVEITDGQWAAMQSKFGDRAKEMVLTWAARRLEHDTARAAGYEPDAESVERDARIQAILRHDKECPCRNAIGDVVDRVVRDRPLSGGMVRWLAGVEIEEGDRVAAKAALVAKAAFETRPLLGDVCAFYGVQA